MKKADFSPAIDYLKRHFSGTIKTAVVLGSGLGDFAEQVKNRIVIHYPDIPGFPESSVSGHAGNLVIGELEGKKIAVMQGRVHRYEGHGPEEVVFPVRLLGLLGVENFILTNAAGGMNPLFRPGDLMLVEDHINLTGWNPLCGPNDDSLGTRFPDMSYAYSPELNKLILKAAKKHSIKMKKGVYLGLLGPTYETPAEIRFFRKIGCSAVGMSTVPEVIAINHMSKKVAAVSCISNMAAGMRKGTLTHEEVKEITKKIKGKFIALLNETIKLI